MRRTNCELRVANCGRNFCVLCASSVSSVSFLFVKAEQIQKFYHGKGWQNKNLPGRHGLAGWSSEVCGM